MESNLCQLLSPTVTGKPNTEMKQCTPFWLWNHFFAQNGELSRTSASWHRLGRHSVAAGPVPRLCSGHGNCAPPLSALCLVCVRAGARVLVCARARARAPLCRRAGPRGRRWLPDAAEPQPEWWPDRHARLGSPPQPQCSLGRLAGRPAAPRWTLDELRLAPSFSHLAGHRSTELSWVAHARIHGAACRAARWRALVVMRVAS